MVSCPNIHILTQVTHMALSVIVAISLFKKIENLIYIYIYIYINIMVIWNFSWGFFIIFLVYVLLSRNRERASSNLLQNLTEIMEILRYN